MEVRSLRKSDKPMIVADMRGRNESSFTRSGFTRLVLAPTTGGQLGPRRYPLRSERLRLFQIEPIKAPFESV